MGSKKDNDETGDNNEKKDNDDDDDLDTIVYMLVYMLGITRNVKSILCARHIY